jgi:transcription factor TFIIIB component B''
LTSATFAKKRVTSNRWSPQETNLFFDAVRMCGTDFSMIESLLPHRSRSQIKGKYKIEERSNSGRLYQALDNPVPYDPKFTEKVNQILSEQNHSKNK